MANIPALTSIRFLAALVVFYHHYLVLGGSRHFSESGLSQALHQLLYEGRYGVTLFFVLSGFLLTARYYDTLYRKVGFKTYWIKRFARIMPLYWFLCLLIFILHVGINFRIEEGARKLRERDILDPPALIESLKNPQTPIARQIRRALPGKMQQRLDKFRPDKDSMDTMVERLVRELNERMLGTPLYNYKRQLDVDIDPRLNAVVRDDELDAARLNRLLLEYAYPGVIARNKINQKRDIQVFLVYFTLTQSFFSDLKFEGVETAWSLTVEECFYLTLPLLILLFRWKWRDHRSLARNLLWVALTLLVVVMVYVQLGRGARWLNRSEVLTTWGLFGNAGDIRTYTIFGRFFDFAVGCLAGMYYLKSSNPLLKRRWLPDAAIALATLGILATCYAIGEAGGLEEKAGWHLNQFNAVLSVVVIYFVCAETSRVARLLAWAPFVYLGEISYAFYLVHKYDYTNWMYRWCAVGQWSFLTSTVVLYAVLSALAALCYELIERPWQHWVLRWTGVQRGAYRPPALTQALFALGARLRRPARPIPPAAA